MFRIIIISISILMIYSTKGFGQEGWHGGFRAGLNYNTITGDVLDGEDFTGNSSFHIGIIVKYNFSDLIGIQTEFLYTQKGGKYAFEGPSNFLLRSEDQPILLSGNRRMNLTITNDYISIPFLFFARLGPIELSAGPDLSYMIGSFGGGNLSFTETSPNIGDIEQELDFRFFKDVSGLFVPGFFTEKQINNRTYTVPTRVGSYYELESRPEIFFKRLEIGLNFGAAYYINRGLFIMGRLNYTPSDITHDEVDAYFGEFSGNYPSIQGRKWNQLSIQASIGFSF